MKRVSRSFYNEVPTPMSEQPLDEDVREELRCVNIFSYSTADGGTHYGNSGRHRRAMITDLEDGFRSLPDDAPPGYAEPES